MSQPFEPEEAYWEEYPPTLDDALRSFWELIENDPEAEYALNPQYESTFFGIVAAG